MNATNPEVIAENEDVQSQDADNSIAMEGEIREFVRRDLAPWRRRRTEAAPDLPVENVNSLIQRVAGQSVHEIDNVIQQLQNVRDLLRNEGDRVQREIVGYANLSQAAMASMKIIADSMNQWKAPAEPARAEHG